MGKADKCRFCGKVGTVCHGLCAACNQRMRRYGSLEYKKDRPRKYSNDIIDVMKKRYPKFSKVALCMIRNREYGVDLSVEAKRYLKAMEAQDGY